MDRNELLGYCGTCGRDVVADFCEECGRYVQPSPHDTEPVRPGSRWAATDRRHRGEVVRVLRCSMTTVKFEVVAGSGNHRKQVYAMPRDVFLRSHREVAGKC